MPTMRRASASATSIAPDGETFAAALQGTSR
jgi:hypothetical protein